MTLPEDLQNVHVNLDSETAKQIADQWITYKYVYAAMEFTLVALVFGTLVFGVVWFIRRAIKAEAKRKEELEKRLRP